MVGHRCRDAVISAEEQSDVGAPMLQDQNFAALVLVRISGIAARCPTTLNRTR